MLRNKVEQLQFVKIEWPCGEEFIHRAHYCNDSTEFHAIMAVPQARARYGKQE
jgi:hypothetical protein